MNRADVLQLAAFERQIAANFRTLNTLPVPQQNILLWTSARSADMRADMLEEIALTVEVGTDPNIFYTPTGNVAQISFDQNAPGTPVVGWNTRANDQTATLPLYTPTGGALTWRIPVRVGETPDSNNYTTMPDPSGSGKYPDGVYDGVQIIYKGGVVSEVLAGLDPTMVYDLTFLGNRRQAGTFTKFIVGDTVKNLDASFNVSRTVTFARIAPDATGKINWQWADGVINGVFTAEYGALSSLVVTEYAIS
jgi:hypothetical protein